MARSSFDKTAIKVLLLEGLHPGAVEILEEDGYTNIKYLKTSLAGDELKAQIVDAGFIGIRSRTQLTADVLAKAKDLKAIGCFCIGTNQVDLAAAQAKGVPVFNAPFSNTRSVAELVVAEIIMLMRGIPEKNARAHRGDWQKTAESSNEVRGKTLGIVGYGHIGTQLGILAEGLGMKVIFHDIETRLSLGNSEPVRGLSQLLAKADVVSLHVPETPDTFAMIGADELEKMKPGSILVNAARGTVVDIDALSAALSSGHLAGAAIDVFPEEPKSNSEEFVSPLREFDNVILTPHIGGSTLEAQESIGQEVAGKLLKYSNNGSTVSAVNFPEVSLPAHPDMQRLIHIHRNEPGVLAQVNEVFSGSKMNIVGEYLQTLGTVGYVVVDVDCTDSFAADALGKLRQIPGTIRARLLR